MPEPKTTTPNTSAAAQPVQRTIALSRLTVADDFNPRKDLDSDGSFANLVASVRQHGILTPIRVRDTGTGDYVLIAGHRRHAAAIQAALTEVPCIIRPAGTGGPDEETQLRVEALIENEHRTNLDPVELADAFSVLRDGGLTLKGVAEQMNTTQARVREHLRILELPDPVKTGLAAGQVPLMAVKALADMAKLHPGLPEVLTAAVAADVPLDEEPLSWAEVAQDPIGALKTLDHELLPAGVYSADSQPLLDELPLSEKAQKDRAALVKLGQPAGRLILDRPAVEQADALKALHRGKREWEWEWLIVGEDVMAQIAADALAAGLTRARKAEREAKARAQEAEEGRKRLQTTPGSPEAQEAYADGEDPFLDAPKETEKELEARLKAERQAARAAELEQRAKAEAFNDRLGIAVTNKLSRIKVDARALRLVASVSFGAELDKLAACGARYGFPGWVTETEGRNGTVKREYLGMADSAAKAREYLAGAQTPGDHLGRAVALLVMASFADQTAVAQSSRIWADLRGHGTPWAADVPALIDDLAAEYLPAGLIDLKLGEREQARAAANEQARLRQEARQRLTQATERGLSSLDQTQLEALQADLEVAYERYAMERYDLDRQLKDALKMRAWLDTEPAADSKPTGAPVEPADDVAEAAAFYDTPQA